MVSYSTKSKFLILLHHIFEICVLDSEHSSEFCSGFRALVLDPDPERLQNKIDFSRANKQ
jgi:hypothetical protein